MYIPDVVGHLIDSQYMTIWFLSYHSHSPEYALLKTHIVMYLLNVSMGRLPYYMSNVLADQALGIKVIV